VKRLDRHLSAVTIAEIQAGIEITRERDVEKANEIEAWLDSVAETYNIIPADAHIFRRCAQLPHRKPDHHLEDALIAATALVRGLSVVTRNVDDFKPFGVPTINPFTRRAP
jgi:predicted nucleic acid-binding protein